MKLALGPFVLERAAGAALDLHRDSARPGCLWQDPRPATGIEHFRQSAYAFAGVFAQRRLEGHDDLIGHIAFDFSIGHTSTLLLRMSDVVITDVPQDSRFVATGGELMLGYIDYSLTGRGMLIRHTDVDPAYEGQGVGAALSRFALDSARERGIEVIPICPFVAGWIMRHPEYSDLVIDAMRGQFERD